MTTKSSPPPIAPPYSAFVAQLAAALHAAGKLLTVNVDAKTSEPGTWDGPKAQELAGSHDIRGVTLWRLGGADPAAWLALRSRFKGAARGNSSVAEITAYR